MSPVSMPEPRRSFWYLKRALVRSGTSSGEREGAEQRVRIKSLQVFIFWSSSSFGLVSICWSQSQCWNRATGTKQPWTLTEERCLAEDRTVPEGRRTINVRAGVGRPVDLTSASRLAIPVGE